MSFEKGRTSDLLNVLQSRAMRPCSVSTASYTDSNNRHRLTSSALRFLHADPLQQSTATEDSSHSRRLRIAPLGGTSERLKFVVARDGGRAQKRARIKQPPAAATSKVSTFSTSFEVGARPSKKRCWHRRQPRGWNIAPFRPGPSAWPMCGRPAARSDGTSPHSMGPSCQRWCAVRGWNADRGGNRPDRTSPHSIRGRVGCWGGPVRVRALRIRRQPAGPNIAPFNCGRVAFPTLRPPRLSAVWGTVAVDEAWKTHDRRRFDRDRFGS